MWREITGSSNYEVSDSGLVRNKHTRHILAPSTNGRGVLKVILSEDGDQQSRTVARLVGEAFVDGYEQGDVIFHVDDDKGNVDARNLQWRPRWFAQEWAAQKRRTVPMRPWRIRMDNPGYIFENSLECAKATFGIEKYIVLSCGRGDQIYNGSTYTWIKE